MNNVWSLIIREYFLLEIRDEFFVLYELKRCIAFPFDTSQDCYWSQLFVKDIGVA